MIIDFPREEHIPGLRALWQEAFQDPEEFVDAFFRSGFSQYRCMCIRELSQPIAALYWFDCRWQDQRIAYVYAVATAKLYRGQGLCHKLMAHTHKILLQLGYSGIVLVPAKPELFTFYKSMGYRCFSGLTKWEATAGLAPAAMKPLTYKEYAQARKAYLPHNSVEQDGALLRFLSTYTQFYAGDDFLLCAAEDKGKLIGYELLGNADAAAGILAALQLDTGTFRAPGNIPFAMYHSLSNNSLVPGYFAFALD